MHPLLPSTLNSDSTNVYVTSHFKRYRFHVLPHTLTNALMKSWTIPLVI